MLRQSTLKSPASTFSEEIICSLWANTDRVLKCLIRVHVFVCINRCLRVDYSSVRFHNLGLEHMYKKVREGQGPLNLRGMPLEYMQAIYVCKGCQT